MGKPFITAEQLQELLDRAERSKSSEVIMRMDQFRDLVEQAKAAMPEVAASIKAENVRMRKALDAIYNHNEAARAAVILHYGLWHDRPDMNHCLPEDK
jgi:hypothetical protein